MLQPQAQKERKIAQQGPGLIQHKNVEGRNTQGLEVEQPWWT
jgi:hypothetical protein